MITKIKNKIFLCMFIIFIFAGHVFAQQGLDISVPEIMKQREILTLKPDTSRIIIRNNSMFVNNLISNFNDNISIFNTFVTILKDDSIQLHYKILEFPRTIEAYEFLCHLLPFNEEKTLNLAWLTVVLNDSLAISWHQNNVYIFSYNIMIKKRFERVLRKLLLPTDKFKDMPNFMKVFPQDDIIRNSFKVTTSPFLQQNYFTQTYYADYEFKGHISRIYIIPVLKDSIFLYFQNFREFWKNRGLLYEQEAPIELPYFIAQDVFLGRMICILYQEYIIGMMNYPSDEWVRNYLEKMRENLKKYPVYLQHPPKEDSIQR